MSKVTPKKKESTPVGSRAGTPSKVRDGEDRDLVKKDTPKKDEDSRAGTPTPKKIGSRAGTPTMTPKKTGTVPRPPSPLKQHVMEAEVQDVKNKVTSTPIEKLPIRILSKCGGGVEVKSESPMKNGVPNKSVATSEPATTPKKVESTIMMVVNETAPRKSQEDQNDKENFAGAGNEEEGPVTTHTQNATPTRPKRGPSFNMGDMMAGLRTSTPQPPIAEDRSGAEGMPTPLRKAAAKLYCTTPIPQPKENSTATQTTSLYETAIRLGCEFVDLEMTMPEEILRDVSESRGFTEIIASHHDPKSELSWRDGSWMKYYNRALQYGTVIKLVGVAKSLKDNFALAEFKSWAETAHPIPLIAINMGEHGKMSRILNGFMTPVSHPLLPSATAPGQLSAADIRRGLSLMGEIPTKKFCIFGSPVSQSPSPRLHNRLFRETGLPHTYGLHETTDANTIRDVIRSPDFGGASVTIPLKQDVRPFIDGVGPEVEAIGALNTIVPETSIDESTGQEVTRLIGRNTDYLGMILILRNAGAHGVGAGLVIGGGGTSRAAIYALREMGYGPIYLLGRNAQKIQLLKDAFPTSFNLHVITSPEEISSVPTVAIGTIPADQPIDPTIRETLCVMFEKAKTVKTERGEERILLEMAYKPPVTALIQLGQDAGWKTVNGLEVLVGQGVHQFEYWTGVRPLYGVARVSVLGDGYEWVKGMLTRDRMRL
jgi:shikimate-5-dehydrogenase